MSDPLNPNSFWNVVFLTGTILAILSAAPIKIPWKGGAVAIKIPAEKQRPFMILGVVLILFSLVIASLPAWNGFLSPAEKSPDTFSREIAMNRTEPILFSLTSAAYAQPQELEKETAASFQLVQRRHLTINKLFDGRLGVYLGDVHLLDPNRIILFDASTRPRLQEKMEVDDVAASVPPGSILADEALKDGESLEFTFEGKKYKLLAHFNWYVVGEDYGSFKIIPEATP